MNDSSSSGTVSIQSPCVNICTLDGVSGLCLGCFRNKEEISRWPTLTPEEKARVIHELENRRKRAGI